MSIKPVLVPDHTANDLRRLMDSFATATTGPTRQQLAESRAAVAAAQGVAEGSREFNKIKTTPYKANQMLGGKDPVAFVIEVLCPDQSVVNMIQTKVGTAYQVERDDSIEGNGIGIEIISQRFDGGQTAQAAYKQILDIIKQSGGQFNNSTEVTIARQTQGVAEGEGMSRAAKGYEKYGREGMAALARAGREGRALDPVRQKYDKYDEDISEAGQPDVMRHKGDTTVKVVKRGGKPIGEIGIDAEASEGNGQYYVKLYDGSYDAVGFDTAAEALAELKYAISEGLAEVLGTSPDRLMARTGMNLPHKFPRTGQTNLGNIPGTNLPDSSEQTKKYGQERRANRPDNLKAAIRDQLGKHNRPDLPESGVAEDDVDDFVAGGGKITQVKPNPGPRRSGVSLGSRHIGTVRGGKASSISGKRANTHSTVKPVVAVEQQVAEKSEAVRHANNPHDHRSRYPVDESVDPIEQLRADIKRFSR